MDNIRRIAPEELDAKFPDAYVAACAQSLVGFYAQPPQVDGDEDFTVELDGVPMVLYAMEVEVDAPNAEDFPAWMWDPSTEHWEDTSRY